MMSANQLRYSNEYLIVKDKQGVLSIELNNEDNYCLQIEDYINDDRLLAVDLLGLRLSLPSNEVSQRFSEIIESLRYIKGGLILLIYLWFSVKSTSLYLCCIELKDIMDNRNNKEWILLTIDKLSDRL